MISSMLRHVRRKLHHGILFDRRLQIGRLIRRRNFKEQQSLDNLCLRKIRAGKSHDYRDVIVFEKLRFQFRSFRN